MTVLYRTRFLCFLLFLVAWVSSRLVVGYAGLLSVVRMMMRLRTVIVATKVSAVVWRSSQCSCLSGLSLEMSGYSLLGTNGLLMTGHLALLVALMIAVTQLWCISLSVFYWFCMVSVPWSVAASAVVCVASFCLEGLRSNNYQFVFLKHMFDFVLFLISYDKRYSTKQETLRNK